MTPLYEYRNIPWKEKTAGQSGRVLVSMESGGKSRLDFCNYEGCQLPACLIYTVLKVALAEGWIEALEKLHQGRKNKWKAEMSESLEGIKEYRLYSIGQNEPVCSSTITISNNQIHTFSILTEDAAPLLKKIIMDYPPLLLPRSRNKWKNDNFPAFYYLYTSNIKFTNLPEPIKKRREETQRIMVAKDLLASGVFQAGESSGIIETIEALKCLEVLRA